VFTGLVQAVARVVVNEPRSWGRRLELDAGAWAHRPARGESIAVAGCCLTVVDADDAGRMCFDVISESIDKTRLGDVRPGDGLNLEHAVRADSLMGGHFVQGHVDGLGEVTAVADDPLDWRVTVAPPGDLMEYVTPKGSVSIDGVSLTIAAVADGAFEVALIPETLEVTTLGDLRAGDRVHLEMDMLAKTVVFWMRRYGER
jgi:riboflavin synthase